MITKVHTPTAATRATGAELPQLNRRLHEAPKAPVRIVHLGLGAFHRSHQAWYTQQAGDAAEWGIAAFTGRSPEAAALLAAQDGLYTLVERADTGDTFTVVGSIVEAVHGGDVERLVELVAEPATAVVTLTITEAAYGLGPDGRLDKAAADVGTDLALLSSGSGTPATPLGRLVLALAARRDGESGPIAVVCCDNLSHNGDIARLAVTGFAEALDAGLAAWIDSNVSFVSTSVDRITPKSTDKDIADVRDACSYRDDSPVVAEPFSSWVLSGDFPAGRPRWEDAGAVFVDDIEPYENRKLWLLNGAHSLLAYSGQLRGHHTVAEALADPVCRQAVNAFWNEAEANLPSGELQVPAYRSALLARFSNARIAHNLSQIAMDGSTKLRMRAVPVMQAERAAGRTGNAAALMIAAWMDCSAVVSTFQDPLSVDVAAANQLSGADQTRALLAVIDPTLAANDSVVQLIETLRGCCTQPAPTSTEALASPRKDSL